MTQKQNKKSRMPKKLYGPASEAQRLILTAQEDVILVGGGEPCASTLKTFL